MNEDNQNNTEQAQPPAAETQQSSSQQQPAPNENVGNTLVEAPSSNENIGNMHVEAPVPDDNIGNRINTAPQHHANGPDAGTTDSVAATAWFDPEEQPDDNIGNRIDGPAYHEHSAVLPQNVSPEATRVKKPHKGRGHGQRGHGQNGRGKRNGNQATANERPSFRIGDEIFGNVVKVMPDAFFIDITGKGLAVFDRREWTDSTIPQPGDQFVAKVRGDGGRGGNIVLTFNIDRIEEGRKMAEEALTSEENIEGLVTGVIKGGVEVDVLGLRAFAPASHCSLKMGSALEPLVGQRLPFKVIKFDKNGKEVVLSRREFIEQEAAALRAKALEKLQIGDVIDGVVRSVMDWGMFVALPSADNIEGLVHVTEASHERTRRLSDLFSSGDKVQVKVLRIDNNGKLWLSAKATAEDPWDKAADKFAPGTVHKGRVARMQPFGAFLELEPGVDGLIRTNDISFKRVNHPEEAVKIGQELDVIVVHLDTKKHQIGLHPAPPADWQEKPQHVAQNRVVKVEVVSPESAGLLVRVLGATGGDARGFIPAGQTGTARGTDLRRKFPVGTKLDAKVIDRDFRRGETKLSLKAFKHDNEKSAYREYRAKTAREAKFGTFGDLLAKYRDK